jgi:hypothetical protein
VDYTHNYQYPVFVAAAAAALAFLLVLPLRKQAMIQTKQSAPQRIDRQRLPNKSCQFRAKIEESEEENAQKSMAVGAQARANLSPPKFPANRENNREFCEFCRPHSVGRGRKRFILGYFWS